MATYSISEIYSAALAAGFTPEQSATWTAIALAESGGRTSALNSHGEHSVGLWQINVAAGVRSNHWGDLNDPLVNARAAYDVSRHGRDLRPWTTTHDSNKGTAHDYRTYLAKVEATVGTHGDWRGVSGYGAPMPGALPDASTAGPQLDSDHDGLTDAFERSVGSNAHAADADHDGLSDGFEIGQSHTDPHLADTDHDGLSDSLEVALGTDPTSADSDHDGIVDSAEVQFGTQPLVADAGDGVGAPPSEPVRSPAPVESTSERFLRAAIGQRGDPYVFGAEARLSDANPQAFDCSELTQWAAHQAGVKIPDGAMYQYLDLKQHGSLISVDEALKTKGALLFSFSSEPTRSGSRPSHAHVAISLGDGRTIEARGRAYGVNEFSAKHRFNFAGVIPGITATDPAPAAVGSWPEAAAVPAAYDQIDSGLTPGQSSDADHDGLTDAFERLAGTNPHRADSDRDGLSDGYEALVSHTDPLSADTDHDGSSDSLEIARGTDPGRLAGIAGVSGTGQYAQNVRTGVVDTDHDGLSDHFEKLAHLDPRLLDTDGDGLSDSLEISLGTDPTRVDTDGDGLTDHLELELGRDPLRVGDPVGSGGLAEGLVGASATGFDDAATDPLEAHPPPLGEHL